MVVPIKIISLLRQTGRTPHLGNWILSNLQMRYRCTEQKSLGGKHWRCCWCCFSMHEGIYCSTNCWHRWTVETMNHRMNHVSQHTDGWENVSWSKFSAELDEKWIKHKPPECDPHKSRSTSSEEASVNHQRVRECKPKGPNVYGNLSWRNPFERDSAFGKLCRSALEKRGPVCLPAELWDFHSTKWENQ